MLAQTFRCALIGPQTKLLLCLLDLSLCAFFLVGGFRPVETYIAMNQATMEVFVALILTILTRVLL